MSVDFREALRLRGVEPNSTWMRDDGQEMLVVLPQDEEAVAEMCARFACEYKKDPDAKPEDPQWIRVLRLHLTRRTGGNMDVYFVPFICGQIDRGILKRIA
jgi:hypothetical protein